MFALFLTEISEVDLPISLIKAIFQVTTDPWISRPNRNNLRLLDAPILGLAGPSQNGLTTSIQKILFGSTADTSMQIGTQQSS